MGGRLFANDGAERLPRYALYELIKIVKEEMSKKGLSVYHSRFLLDKNDFGDLDFILPLEDRKIEDVKSLIDSLHPAKKVLHNGMVSSVLWESGGDVLTQIDFILSEPQNLDATVVYYSFNDLNGLIGKIFYSHGLKFGHKGLLFNIETKRTKKEIVLMTDPKKIYELIGLDFNRWLEGFYTVDEIIEFVKTSPFAKKEVFEINSLTHRQRTRDQERSTFQALYGEFDITLTDERVPKKTNRERLELCKIIIKDENIINHIESDLKWIEAYEERIDFYKEVFPVSLIMSIFPELKGRSLGDMYQKLKRDAYINFTIYSDKIALEKKQELIKEHIQKTYGKATQ